MEIENTGILPEFAPGRVGTAGRSSWGRAFADAFAETHPLFLILAVYAAAAIAISAILDVSLVSSVVGYARILALIAELGASLGILALFISLAIRERPRHPTRRLIEEIARVLRPAQSVRAFLLIFSFLALQAIYVFFKPLIPRFVPFSWDPLFAGLDRALFLGHDPWTVLWPLFGNPPATLVINTVYHLWFFWKVMVVVLVAFATAHRAANLRFFLAFILTWIVGGTVLATIFSSVGPCFYGFVYAGADPFQPLLAGLDALNVDVPVFARSVQAILWDGQMNPAPGKLVGISAMPSMHVATVFLLTRIAFVHDRRLGYVSAVAAGLIYVGSILLAWHYALDGIAGALLAWGAWTVAGAILWRRQPASVAA